MPPRHLYVHVPFCARRCAYCDFSIAVRRTTPVDEYLGALQTELAMVAREMNVEHPGDWTLDTLYLGGGTPSQLGEAIPRLFDLVGHRTMLAPRAEVTMEANPEDVTQANAESWRRAGANRISLGSQSFDPAVLSWMHRAHSADQIEVAVKTARDAGFEDISLDLIFAVPHALNRDWKHDLDAAIGLDPSHISLYGLTVEPRTPLHRWRDRGEVREAGEDAYANEFLLAHNTLAAAGYEHYEVSNFAKLGRHSRHNSAYWSGASYTGLGPSAHSFDGARRWWNVAPYAQWVDRLSHDLSPVADVEVLDEENVCNERIYLGLRSTTGVRVDARELPELQPWVDKGWAAFSEAAPRDQARQAAPEGGAPQERLSRRRSSGGALHPGAASAAMVSPGSSKSQLTLTPTGWLLLDELAASLTWIRSRSYV
ncbi:MAG: radical SAM family heme chaperone HemW [Gemmatimonadaceae bacterium]